MINILPESGRSTARREYLLRLTAASLFMAAVLSLCIGAMLTPAYVFATLAQRQAQDEEARVLKTKNDIETGDTGLLGRTNEQVKRITRLLEARKPSAVTESLFGVVGTDVSIVRMSYGNSDNILNVSGKAATREALLSFVKSVQALPAVASAEVPVGDLAKNTDVQFNLTVTLSQKP